TGWAAGVALLAYLCVTTNYTGKVLGRIMDTHPDVRTFADMGSLAFGVAGKRAITCVFCVELVAALAMFLTVMVDNLLRLVEHSALDMSRDVAFGVCAAVVLPTCWTDRLSVLSHLSVVGIVSCFCLFFCLVVVGLTTSGNLGKGGSFRRIDWAGFVAFGEADRLPYALGLFMVGFSGHVVFPSIRDGMTEPKRFSQLVDAVYVISALLYLAMGLVGFLLFTRWTKEEVTLNLADVAGGSALVTLTTWLIVINPFTKFALTLNPLATIALHAIGGAESNWWLTKVQRTVLTLLTLLVAIFTPSFASICAFVGAFCSFVVSVIFPLCCFVATMPLSARSRRFHIAFIALNVVLCVVGTIAVFFPPQT
ncbi:Amino acid transporter AVT1E (AtAvt1E), partial [Durusdinium trenchii]